MKSNVCHGCLKGTSKSYCPRCRKEMFNGRSVGHIMQITLPEFTDLKLRAGSKISISGIQIKHSMKLEKNKLVLTEYGGEYILKPAPRGSFLHLDQVPANEHLTMQIARHIFSVDTAVNALVLFAGGEPAYITKRFDFAADKTRLLVEDFAQIAGKTEDIDGKDYKYGLSYEEVAESMAKYVAAYPADIEKYFRLVLFNYIISNGDAHLKNFALYRNNEYGDYLLTPAYDLLCTRLHSPYESDMALDLFKDNYESETYKHGSKYTTEDFIEFGNRIGIRHDRIVKIISDFNGKEKPVEAMISRSFLSEDLKRGYFEHFINKSERLKII